MNLESIPPELLSQFNQVSPVDRELLDIELRQTDVQMVVNVNTCRIHYGLRHADGAAIVMVENAQTPHLIFLPGGSG